jgi:glycosyltransferase involved in cell wall biosynthesis
MNHMSVLIIAYNEPILLSKCLRSLQALSAVNDILIFDNYSYLDVIESNRALIEEISKTIPVRIEKASEDKPLSVAYNWGVSQSKNDILLMCDSDTELLSGKAFDTCLDTFNSDSNLAVLGFLCSHKDDAKVSILSPFYLNYDKLKPRHPLTLEKSQLPTWKVSTFPPILRQCFCIKKQAFTFKDTHWYGCDVLHYLLECRIKNKKICLRKDLTFQHNKSVWRTLRKERSRAWKARELKSHEIFLKKALCHPILIGTLLFRNKI